jgi:hypothetical protein
MHKFADGQDTPAKKRSAGGGLPASAAPGAGMPAAAGAAIQAIAPTVTVTAVTMGRLRIPIRVWFICHTSARQGPLLLPEPAPPQGPVGMDASTAAQVVVDCIWIGKQWSPEITQPTGYLTPMTSREPAEPGPGESR